MEHRTQENHVRLVQQSLRSSSTDLVRPKFWLPTITVVVSGSIEPVMIVG